MGPSPALRGLILGLFAAFPATADAVFTLGFGAREVQVPPSGIAAMEISESGGITDVFLRLMPGAAQDLADLTGDAAGQVMALRVCGVTLMQAEAGDRIGTGTVYLAGTTMVRAEAMRALWHGRATCDTLGAEVFGHGQ